MADDERQNREQQTGPLVRRSNVLGRSDSERQGRVPEPPVIRLAHRPVLLRSIVGPILGRMGHPAATGRSSDPRWTAKVIIPRRSAGGDPW